MARKMTGEAVKAVRTHLKLTQREICYRLGITEKTWRDWERNGAPPVGTVALEGMLMQEEMR